MYSRAHRTRLNSLCCSSSLALSSTPIHRQRARSLIACAARVLSRLKPLSTKGFESRTRNRFRSKSTTNEYGLRKRKTFIRSFECTRCFFGVNPSPAVQASLDTFPAGSATAFQARTPGHLSRASATQPSVNGRHVIGLFEFLSAVSGHT